MEFQECNTCKAKSGTPILCSGCLHNRALIEELKEELTLALEDLKDMSRMNDEGGPL